MDFEEKLSNVQNDFFNYDFTDSIIEEMTYSDGLTDFKVAIDYYFTEKDEEHITIIFKNCTFVNYFMPKDIYEFNDYKLNFSQFTITKTKIVEEDRQICIKIYTISDEKEFLKIVCQDVLFN